MHLSRRSFLVILSALGLVAGAERAAQADAVADALADIAKARAGLKTMVAPFTQERTIGLLATAVKSEGELSLVRTDRLRWERGLKDGGPSGIIGGSLRRSLARHPRVEPPK